MTILSPAAELDTARLRAACASLLEEARARTLEIISTVTDEDLARQHDPLMSPIVWDLGHIAHFEALWLTHNLDGPIEFVEMPGLYNPFETPRAGRGALQLPGREAARLLLAETRRDVLARLAELEFPHDHPLLHDGYVFRMVAQHEYQHNETMLQALQLKQGEPYRPFRRVAPPPVAIELEPGAMARFAGGVVTLGTDDRAAAYDNERPRHEEEVAPFRIDVAPVTNGQYLAFIDDGGYANEHWWSEAGWSWLQSEHAEAPRYWTRRDGGWTERQMNQVADIDPRRPVSHVSFWEAEAFARWAGKRLPTETEWEVACTWNPRTGAAQRFPWGDDPASPELANVDQRTFGTAPIGAYARNVSPLGCYGMIGDVWEWTATNFHGYPGFEAFPYPEYSEAFFGSEYKVLRGGAWATRSGAIRGTFRNWDYPQRRQIFSGFRCAADD